jgi:hypothetical protein
MPDSRLQPQRAGRVDLRTSLSIRRESEGLMLSVVYVFGCCKPALLLLQSSAPSPFLYPLGQPLQSHVQVLYSILAAEGFATSFSLRNQILLEGSAPSDRVVDTLVQYDEQDISPPHATVRIFSENDGMAIFIASCASLGHCIPSTTFCREVCNLVVFLNPCVLTCLALTEI